MLIEKITTQNLKALKNDDLKQLRFRFIQLFNRYVQKVESGVKGMNQSDFLTRYVLLRVEMNRREIPINLEAEIDRVVKPRIQKKAIWGLDPKGLGEIMLVENFMVLTGAFVRDPKGAKEISVVVKAAGTAREATTEIHVNKALMREIGREAAYVYAEAGAEEPNVPIFDLVLRPKAEIRKVYSRPTQKSETKASAAVEKPFDPEMNRLRQEEGKKISENRRTQEARMPHKFIVAKYPGWDEKERCLICGDSRPESGSCVGADAGWETQEAVGKKPAQLADIKKDGEMVIFQTWGMGKTAAFFETAFDADKAIEIIGATPGTRALVKAEAPVRISKPETTAAYHRIPVRPIPKGAEIRTITLSEEQGIKALEDIGAKKIVTYLLDAEKFTMAEAKAWVEAHKAKKTVAKRIAGAFEFRIIKVDAKKRLVGGIVYEPQATDTQGDFTTADEIEEAKRRFMEKYAKDPRRIKVMHEGKAYTFPVIESFQPEEDTKKGADVIKAGAWWIMIKITDDKTWKQIEDGKLQGFSMGGRARPGK